MIVTTALAFMLSAPSAFAVTTENSLITEVKGSSSSSSKKKKSSSSKSKSSSSKSSSSKSSSSKGSSDDDDKGSKETKTRPDDGGKSQGERSSQGRQGDSDSSRGDRESKGGAERGGARERGHDKGSKNNRDNNRAEKAKAKTLHKKGNKQKAKHKNTSHYRKVHRYHGIFVWGPRPSHHHYYSGGNSSVSNSHMPVRRVNRANTLALGLRMGSLVSGYDNAEGYADPGLGLMMRYRPVEALGFEFSHQEYGVDTNESYRLQTLTQASVEVFVVPWSRFSPYVLIGATTNNRNIDDDYYNNAASTANVVNTQRPVHGLHVGLGAEIALGSRFAIDLETRLVNYGDMPADETSADGALQTMGSLVYHF